MNDPKVVLYARISPDLYRKLKNEADKEYRNMNSQLIMIIEKFLNEKEKNK